MRHLIPAIPNLQLGALTNLSPKGRGEGGLFYGVLRQKTGAKLHLRGKSTISVQLSGQKQDGYA
jgi:hypothetical protein